MEDSIILILAERARAKLLQVTLHHDPDIRRAVGHANLLDNLTMQICKFNFANKDEGGEGELADSSSRLYTDDESDSSDDSDPDSNSSDNSDSSSSDDSDVDTYNVCDDLCNDAKCGRTGHVPFEFVEDEEDYGVEVENWEFLGDSSSKTVVRILVQEISELDTRSKEGL